ncbi:MAG TPA: hypothetical protein VJ698_12765 [Noviherbaspirillum sp.]|uniref:hypothetical protein n=1 Tax=Noviherbaspirillum sp. TaxID=1926288 RepID=UPI002B4775A8|nr:hypothetical protein [Noviherbaspirillum sp.]HJV86338.1 hypothetical protein [Noviherbaspirillum sp.]
MTTRPETLFEAASYDLNKFRERRMAERRATQRNTPDRRMQRSAAPPADQASGATVDPPPGKDGSA